MKANEMIQVIRACIQSNEPAFMRGTTGIGKSQIAEQVAELESLKLVDFRALLRDPVDLRGMPVPNIAESKTTWLRPDDLPFLPYDGAPCLVFMDEINTASDAMQNACLGLVLERRVGQHVLAPSTRILAAGNYGQKDGTRVNKMSEALKSRFAIFDLEPDAEQWRAHAAKKGIAPVIIAFIAFRPERLVSLKSESNDKRPDPRAWFAVANMLPRFEAIGRNAVRNGVAGKVGTETADEFMAFYDIWKNAVSPAQIAANPTGADVPTLPGMQYAVTFALSSYATPANFGALAQYMERMPPEFATVFMLDSTKRKPELLQTSTFVQWGIANQAVMTQ